MNRAGLMLVSIGQGDLAITGLLAAVGSTASVVLARVARRIGVTEHTRHLADRREEREIPGWLGARTERLLANADIEVAPKLAVEIWLGGAAIVGFLSLGFAPLLAAPVFVGMVAAGPVGLQLANGRRERRMNASLPGMLEEVARELRGGGTVHGAIQHFVTRPGPLRVELGRVLARTELGLGLDESLAAWPGEAASPGIRATVGALSVAASIGGQAATALDGLAASLRERGAVMAEARALATQARLSATVVGAAPLMYLAFSALVDQRAIRVLAGTMVGRVCIVVGIGMEIAAAAWMRRIVKVEE